MDKKIRFIKKSSTSKDSSLNEELKLQLLSLTKLLHETVKQRDSLEDKLLSKLEEEKKLRQELEDEKKYNVYSQGMVELYERRLEKTKNTLEEAWDESRKLRKALKSQDSAPAQTEPKDLPTCSVCFENTKDDFPSLCGHKLCMDCFAGIHNSIPKHEEPKCPCCRKVLLFRFIDSEDEEESEEQAPRRIQRCSRCGDSGHNIRTCPF